MKAHIRVLLTRGTQSFAEFLDPKDSLYQSSFYGFWKQKNDSAFQLHLNWILSNDSSDETPVRLDGYTKILKA